MAKFNKAFIPLGISGAFVAFGLVGSLAINAAYNVMYVPEDIVIEDAGGEDIVAENPEDLTTELLKVKVYSGDYYASLKEETSDPEPEEGFYNSIAITCEGGTSSLQRKLIVTQNQAGAFYQYAGYQVTSGIKNTQNALIGFSRHGMYMKFNEYTYSAEDPSKTVGKEQEVIQNSITKHRGKWYEVAVTKELPATPPIPTSQSDMDAYYDYMGSYTAKLTADQWYGSFKNALNGNKNIIDQLIDILQNAALEQQPDSKYYTGEYKGVNISLSLDDSSKPKFTLSGGGETEELVIEHINNTKVRIVESGDGDFDDLLGKGLAEYYKSTVEEGGGM